MLQFRSAHTADGIAYRFIGEEHTLTQELTYGELHSRALQIAASLKTYGNKGDRVLMMYHSSQEFIPAFFGCLYAGMIAVPAYPPRKNHHALRLRAIIEDAGVNLVASVTAIHRQATAMDGYEQVFGSACWLNTDVVSETDTAEPDALIETPAGEDVMFLQYTSGSTGNPKGVVVTHENMLANLAMLYEALEVNTDSVYISWLPYFHDMGLIGVILEALYAGVPAVMMSPAHFLQKPVRWLQAISRYGGTVSGAPNFAYDLCVDKIKEEDLEGIDLSSWKVAFNGAEPVSAATLNRFCERFEKYGFKRSAFLPSFGLAEATLFVSARLQAGGPSVLYTDAAALQQGSIKPVAATASGMGLVSCGYTWHAHELAVVNPDTAARCAEGQVGELWFKGKSVAKGYWNKQEQTAAVFEARISNSDEGPYLRTGDLGFLYNGEVYVTGRLKDLLIIRGSNYYPQDLELAAWKSHPALAPHNAAVFTVDTLTGSELVVLQEVQRTALRHLPANEVFEAIITAVSAAYGLTVADILLLPPGGVLKTSSGKIQRAANKQAYLAEECKPVARWKTACETRENIGVAPAAGEDKAGICYELENLIRQQLAALLGVSVHGISTDKDFSSFGLDSVGAIQLSDTLQISLGRPVPPGIIYDYPTISQLARYFAAAGAGGDQFPVSVSAEGDQDIAIIGMSGRFPGAENLAEYEKLLFDAENAVTTPGVDAPVNGEPRKVSYRSGYVGGTHLFDAGFFEIAPKEAKAVDPQQRLLLELCYTTMQHAGYAPQKLKGAAVGVFMGISNFDYAQLSLKHGQHKNAYFGTGAALSISANRVSYFFDFKGPSICIDTACSSSLVAIHQAIKSIRTGECPMALAGGVNLILSDTVNEYLDAGKLLAKDGHCKTFDAAADGYVRGEGAGVVLLKSKQQAIKDKDTILAVIKGSAVVQDGHSNGLLAPNGVSQQQVVQQALADAGVPAASVCYVETHGTGTALGDPIEVAALDRVFATGRDAQSPLVLGAVKANIGHLESAAGIAGLIKTVICLRRKEVPEQVHFKQHNPNMAWSGLCVKIPTAILRLHSDAGPLRAGVSSFGFGGTNAHVILEEAPVVQAACANQQVLPALPYGLVTLSAKTPETLEAQVSALQAQIMDESLPDLCFSLATTRDHFQHRLVIKCSSTQQLQHTLQHLQATGMQHPDVVYSGPDTLHHRKAFLFTGGGAQYAGMTEALYTAEPVFKSAIDACIIQANRWLDTDLSTVLFALPGTEGESLLHRIDYMQPALFAWEYAMSKLWMHWGVLPDVLIGHSLGEIVAACVAGVFDLEDGMRLICARGRLMHSLPPGGVMISLQAGEAEVQKAVAAYAQAVSIAVINGPDQTVIAGEQKAAENIKKIFDNKGVKTKVLQVSHASHSVLMNPILEQYRDVVAAVTFRKPCYTLISNTTGREADASICTPQYWVDHLRNTVRFSSGVQVLETTGIRTFIEVGPQPVLLGIVKECLPAAEAAHWLPSARTTDQAAVYDSLARLYAAGGAVNWDAFYAFRPAQKIALPAYPFRKEAYWIDTATTSFAVAGTHTLLPGYKVALAGDTEVYELTIDAGRFSYLAHHQVMGTTLVPAAFFCEMVQAWIGLAGNTAYVPEEILFEKPLMLEAAQVTRVQLLVQKEADQQRHFTIHGAHAEKDSLQWSVLVRGTFRYAEAAPVNGNRLLKEIQQAYTEVQSVAELYDDFAIKGMAYGPCFQPVQELYTRKNSVLGKIQLPAAIAETDIAGYAIHPVLLDGCFQLLNVLARDAAWACLPFSVEGYRLYKNSGNVIWAELTTSEKGFSGDIKTAALTLWNEQGEKLAVIEKLVVKKVTASLLQQPARSDWQYHLNWKIIAPAKAATASVAEKWLIITGSSATESVQAFAAVLKQKGITVTVAGDWHAIAAAGSIHKVVCFWHKEQTASPAERAEANALAALEQLQGLLALPATNNMTIPGGWWWVTEGANAFSAQVVADPSLAPLWGLGRVFMREHPELPFKLADVCCGDAPAQVMASLAELIASPTTENELAVDQAHVYALRLLPGLPGNTMPAAERRRLRCSEAGAFDSLLFEAVPAKPVDAMAVEIEVKYAGLNFRDIFRVLGLIAHDKGELGGECSGIVVKVGAGVKGLKAGDEVMALAEGSFAHYVTTDYRLVARKPANLTLEQAATIPITFLTAWYGLKNLAAVQPGEKVLIHSAAGGVGMAAIQLVHYLGGSVYGTASSTKWEEVRKWGVTRVYDSRTLDFYKAITTDTAGAGVDVVLNSFIDAFTDRSLDLLSAGGRFLEIGKRDIRATDAVAKSHPGICYTAYDLIYLMQHEQQLISKLFAQLVPLFEEGVLRPLPSATFSVQQAQQAFQFMSKARHTGKVLLAIQAEEVQPAKAFQFSQQATVLITGGLGGLGVAVAQYLVQQYKPAHLLLVGRQPPAAAVRQELDKLQQQGVLITTRQADVTDKEALAAVIAAMPAMYPLKGVMHLAGMLDDALIKDQENDRFIAITAPKIQGAWHLHELTKNHSLELFVLFSSAAALLGSAGQSNYAAGNAFLDSLAHYRRSLGLPACSINWGPWESAGLVHRMSEERKTRIRKQGIGLLSNQEGLALLGEVLEKQVTQPVLLPVLTNRLSEVLHASPYPVASLFRELPGVKKAAPAVQEAQTWVKLLTPLPAQQRQQRITEMLQQEIAGILSMPDAGKIHLDKSLQEFGMDSLMAVELRNKLSVRMGKKLPVTLLFDYPNVLALAAYLVNGIVQEEKPAILPAEKLIMADWRETVYRQLMLELKATGRIEEYRHDQVVKGILDEMNLAMDNALQGRLPEDSDVLEGMSLEELENEFEKELKNI